MFDKSMITLYAPLLLWNAKSLLYATNFSLCSYLTDATVRYNPVSWNQ